MTRGEQIQALLKQKRSLEEDLSKTNEMLRELKSSCPHENTRKGEVIFLLNTPDCFNIPVMHCLDCGKNTAIPKENKRRKRKVDEPVKDSPANK